MLPAFFKKYGNVAAASAVINSCTYIGSAASIYGIALLSEKLGWSFTIMTWVIIGTAGCLLCLISAKPFEKEFLSESSNSN
jgi:OPA family glycerol-3-phosphate transporter-like MFS transporter